MVAVMVAVMEVIMAVVSVALLEFQWVVEKEYSLAATLVVSMDVVKVDRMVVMKAEHSVERWVETSVDSLVQA